MWKRAEVLEGARYRVALCQSSTGHRTYKLQPLDERQRPSDAALITDEVPTDLLLRRDFGGIAEAVRLNDGKRFWTDAHGIWLTQEEMDALSAGFDHTSVPWLNGLPARFPPR
jgi:hypothetical protein